MTKITQPAEISSSLVIAPRTVDGEPMCSGEQCPAFYWSDVGDDCVSTFCGSGKDRIARFCQSRPEKVPCIPAIRQERDDAHKALGWCLEGFEAEKCEGFYESPLYKKIERLLGDALIRKIQAAEAREEE